MANEVEASDLAVAKEDHSNEVVSHVSSLVEGAAAEESTQDVKDVKLEEKTAAEIMKLDNETPESVLTGTEGDDGEKAKGPSEESKVTGGSPEVVGKPDLNTVNEGMVGTEFDLRPELGCASLASSEPKPVDEVTPGPEAIAGDEPVGTCESKPANELVPGTESGDVPEKDEKPLSGPELGKVPKKADEPLSGLESSEVTEEDKPIPVPEPSEVPEDKPSPGPEPSEVPEDKPSPGSEPSEVPEDKPSPGPESSEVPKKDEKPLPGSEPSEVPEDKPSPGSESSEVPEKVDEPVSGPELSEVPKKDEKPLPGSEPSEVPEKVDEPLSGPELSEVPKKDEKPLPGSEPSEVPEDKPSPGPEPSEVPEDKPSPGPESSEVPKKDEKPLPGSEPSEVPEKVDEPVSGPELSEVPKKDEKPLPGPEPSDITEEDKPIPSPESNEVPKEDEKPLLDPEPSEVSEKVDEPVSGPEPSEVQEEGKALPSPEPIEVPQDKLGPEPGEVSEKDDKPSPIEEEVTAGESEQDGEPLPGPEQGPGDEEIPGSEPQKDDRPLPGGEAEEDEPSPVEGDITGGELEQDGEPLRGPEQGPGDEEIPCPETVQTDKHEQSDEAEAEDEPGPDVEGDSEDEEKEMLQDEDNPKEKVEKPLDDDQDRRNPQYIPKGGAFYEHDNRTSLEDVENKDPQENEKKKKSWKESKDSEEWLHDCYNESEQLPKSTAEIIKTYGYDIRRDDAPPRARRRRKYGRGPDKYERSWEDEQAYQMKQSNIGRRGRKKIFGKDEFPPLPNQKFDSTVSKPVQKSSIRKKEEVGSKSVNVKLNGNDKPPTMSQASRLGHSGNQNNLHGVNSNRKSYSNTNKKLNDSDIKPFRNDDGKWKMPFKHGRQDDFPKPIRTQPVRHTDPPFRRSVEANKSSAKEPHMSQMTDGIGQMTFVNKQADMRDMRLKANGPEESKISEPEVENPVSRQNPKRYSKIRKGFTGIFPPEKVPELDQSELHKLQQEQQKSQHMTITQPLNMQNVMKRYAGTYGNLGNCVSDFVPGTSSYLQARPIISGIPPQALSPQGIHQQALSPQGIHQQALSPQAIPQQALSPQVSGLQTIELQQNPLAQPNFVPQPMYVDPHYTSDVMAPFTGYPPYSGNQAGDVYQPSRGITYYNTECQTSGQKRPPPRRQNAAIPILPPEK